MAFVFIPIKWYGKLEKLNTAFNIKGFCVWLLLSSSGLTRIISYLVKHLPNLIAIYIGSMPF